MGWSTLKIPTPPAAISSAVSGLQTIASAASTALSVVKLIVEGLSSSATNDLSDSQSTIQNAVSTIQSAIQALLSDTGVYVLLVPPRSKVILPAEVKAALSESFAVEPTPEGLNTQAMFSGELTTNEEAAILRKLFSATGGNAGFVRTVTESFDDTGDANRPILQDSDAVAGVYIVAGSSNMASLVPFTNGMSSILTPGRPTALDSPSIPSPQNVTARVVTGGAVRVQWTFQQPIVEVPTLGTFAEVTEVAIIQSTSVKMLSASTPQELFNSNTLSQGMTSGDGFTKVIAVLPYSALPSPYLDTGQHDPSTGYYYAVSFHVKLGSSKDLENGNGTDLNFPRLSNVQKVYFGQDDHGTPRSIVGTPPDWYRTPRTVDLFPAMGSLLDQVIGLTSQIGDTTTGYADLLKGNVKVLEQQIKSYSDLATRLTAASSTISALTSINLGSVSARTFSGSGGIPFVKKDLVQAFGDTSDPQRPPFDDDEFVAGVVVLATTPGAAALLQTFFGGGAGASTVEKALAEIDVALEIIETATFNADMSPQPAGTPQPVPPVPPALISLVGEPAPLCFHSFTPSVDFGDDLNPT